MYDVFLSFRGEDTRDNFTSILHYVLSLKSIKTFIDDQLIRGENISHSLLDTIEASSISIIIFSERYASSRWCLDELLKILACKHDYGQIVIPVFYQVDPSHVRSQSQDSSFGKYFSGLEKLYPEKMQRWKNALTEGANLSGFDSHVIRPESKLIEEIANDVLKRLDSTFQSENKGLVGVECPIEEIESLLCIGSEGVCKLGIWGIGGIGKTTIAGAVFNKFSGHFEGSYFALNVREAEETGRIKDLQKELLSKLLNDGNVRNIEFELYRLARKKVLIVFDDVSNRRQIQSLIGCLDELASGSRVIITTRDKQVLKTCWASQIYRMKELVYADAHKLFRQCAFGGDHPDASHTELTDKAIEYAQGVPLALKVLGCHLCGRSKEVWESAMRKLEIIPHEEIQEVLKISYDSLDDSQKNVFLDIAFFFEGEHRDVVISFFDASGFEAKIELSVLECKSLVTLDFLHRIRMHDLLRDMGREIVRKESIDYPGNRSRLWQHKDISEVLKKNTGTEAIKGIFLNCPLDMFKVNKEIDINPCCFSNMNKLRFLKINGYRVKGMVSQLEGAPFTEVRYLEWWRCPVRTLNIRAENLVSLQLPYSKVEQLWDDDQNFINLEKIDLSGSEQLMKLPDLSLARNLKILKLCGCSSLMETHSSIQCLNKLEVLDLEDCKSLTSLPNSIHSKYLKEFKISGCSSLKNFPDISSSRIPFLDLKEVGIKELPSSIECLSELTKLQIDNCSRLEKISNSIFNLKSLSGIGIRNCSNLKGFSEFPFCTMDETRIERVSSSTLRLKSLSSLQIIDCKKLERLPDELGNLEALRVLKVEGAAIREVPESLSQLAFLSELKLKNCSELEYISSNIFKLKSFIYIEISNCSNLKSFPKIPSCNIDGSTGIERPSSSTLRLENCSSLVSLSSSLCMLKSLSSLQIIDCKKLERLPESLGKLALLCELKMIECSSFESLPSSLCMLKRLTSLAIIDCKNFKRLPNELGNLKCLVVLIVKGTAIREVPESLGQLSSLVRLDLSNNNLERTLASLYQLSSIKYLKPFDNNFKHRLLTLSGDFRNRLKLDLLGLTETVYDGLRKLSFHGQSWIKSMYFPGNEIPKWFRHQSAGSTITLKMPQPPSASYNKLMGFAFCAVVAFPVSDCFRHESVEDDWKCNLLNVSCDWKFKSKGFLYPHFLGQISPVESDHVFLGSYPFDREYSYANYDEFSFHIKGSYGQHPECCEVKKCGIHFVHAQDSMEST